MPLIWVSIIILCALGAALGAALAVAAKKLAVREDRPASAVYEVLPHLDCGSCGFGSCVNYARNVAKRLTGVDRCAPGGEETAKKIARIMGVEVPEVGPRCAVIHCGAGASARKVRFVYDGVKSCQAANAVGGGYTACTYACLGFGDCERACPFSAIEMVDGLPRVLLDKCTACGKCAHACPRKLITVEKYRVESGLIAVACSSLDKGSETKKLCEVGCIACKICEKEAPGVFEVRDNLSRVNYQNFQGVGSCQKAIEECPTSCIVVIVPEHVPAAQGCNLGK